MVLSSQVFLPFDSIAAGYGIFCPAAEDAQLAGDDPGQMPACCRYAGKRSVFIIRPAFSQNRKAEENGAQRDKKRINAGTSGIYHYRPEKLVRIDFFGIDCQFTGSVNMD